MKVRRLIGVVSNDEDVIVLRFCTDYGSRGCNVNGV